MQEEESKNAKVTPQQWQFTPDETSPTPASPVVSSPTHAQADEVMWTASEFVAHQRGVGWFAALALASVLGAGLVYLITRDAVSTGVIILLAILFGAFAIRKPRVLQYRLGRDGLGIGEKFYGYDLFRSFSVVDEGAVSSILLMPLKRFMPTLSIYYEAADEDKIIELLADHLPMENHQHDTVDRFMHKIRF